MLLINGDCIKEMQKLIDDGVQVDSVVTDPPYELGFMGKSWDSTGIAFNPKTWELALKLLKPGGHLLGFSASRNYHRMAIAIEDAGFEIRDQMMWLYGSGFPKSLNIGDGWGTALKPAHEPIVMARKFIEGTNKQNKEKYGTGGINIDGCRVEGNDANGAERKTANRKSRDDGNVWTDDNSGMKQEDNHFADADPRGRFPANVMHDGSEEVKDIFPHTKSGKDKNPTEGNVSGFFGNNMGYYSKDANYGDEGSAARYFYCPKTSKAEKNKGLDSFEAKPMAWGNQAKAELKRGNLEWKGNQGDGSKHNKVSMRLNTHPTVKPVELMKYLCRLVTPKGGTVLDPFMGSGSTGMAAKDEGFDFIGIEKDEEYFKICESRIKITSPLMDFM